MYVFLSISNNKHLITIDPIQLMLNRKAQIMCLSTAPSSSLLLILLFFHFIISIVMSQQWHWGAWRSTTNALTDNGWDASSQQSGQSTTNAPTDNWWEANGRDRHSNISQTTSAPTAIVPADDDQHSSISQATSAATVQMLELRDHQEQMYKKLDAKIEMQNNVQKQMKVEFDMLCGMMREQVESLRAANGQQVQQLTQAASGSDDKVLFLPERVGADMLHVQQAASASNDDDGAASSASTAAEVVWPRATSEQQGGKQGGSYTAPEQLAMWDQEKAARRVVDDERAREYQWAPPPPPTAPQPKTKPSPPPPPPPGGPAPIGSVCKWHGYQPGDASEVYCSRGCHTVMQPESTNHMPSGSWCTVATQTSGWPGNDYGENKSAADFFSAQSSFASFRTDGGGHQVGISNKWVELANIFGRSVPLQVWIDNHFIMHMWNKNAHDTIMTCKECKVQFHCHICAGDRKGAVHEWKDMIGQDFRNFLVVDDGWFPDSFHVERRGG